MIPCISFTSFIKGVNNFLDLSKKEPKTFVLPRLKFSCWRGLLLAKLTLLVS